MKQVFIYRFFIYFTHSIMLTISAITWYLNSFCLSVISRTQDILKTDMNDQNMITIANQFCWRYSNVISPLQQIHIIKGQYPVIIRNIIHILTQIDVYCHNRWTLYRIFHIKGCYKEFDRWKIEDPNIQREEARYKNARNKKEYLAIDNGFTDVKN